MTFTIEIASVPDRDALIAEIWFGPKLVAEIQRIDGRRQIEIYGNTDCPWVFDFTMWLGALSEAEDRLNRHC